MTLCTAHCVNYSCASVFTLGCGWYANIVDVIATVVEEIAELVAIAVEWIATQTVSHTIFIHTALGVASSSTRTYTHDNIRRFQLNNYTPHAHHFSSPSDKP